MTTSTKLRRVLVANRGEIAVRIVRACRDEGVDAIVAVSEADQDSLAARLATDVVHIGLIAMLQGADADLFNRACFNYPTLGDLYKYATYDALMQVRARTRPGVAARKETNHVVQ